MAKKAISRQTFQNEQDARSSSWISNKNANADHQNSGGGTSSKHIRKSSSQFLKAQNSPLVQRLIQPLLSPIWHETQKVKLESQFKKECPFQPNSLKVGFRSKSGFLSQTSNSNLGDVSANMAYNKKKLSLDISKVIKDPLKFKSRDLMPTSGNHHENLFNLRSKID